MSSDNEEVTRMQLLARACPNGHLGSEFGCDFCGCDECNFGCHNCRGRVNPNLASFLEEAGVAEYDIVGHFRFLSNTIRIFVQAMNGKTITLDVDQREWVEELKGQLEVIVWVPPGRQRLIFEGEVLDDDKRLADYNIQNESTLTLAFVDMDKLTVEVIAKDGVHVFDGVKRGYILNTVDGTVLKTERWKDSGMITILTTEGYMQSVFGHTEIDTVGKCKRVAGDDG